MKKKCPVCKIEKARRVCALNNGESICSRCCAQIRGPECGECPHYAEALRHAVQRKSGPPDGHFMAEINPEVQAEVDGALELAEQGKMSEAFRSMERLAAENPRNHHICFGMGCLYGISGKFDEAISWLEKSVSIFPYMAEAHYNLGIAYQRAYDIGKMIQSLRKAVEYGNPREDYHQKARLQLEKARQVIGKNDGVDLDNYVESSERFNAAFALMEKQQWEDALRGFKAAAACNRRNAPTHGNMGICLAQLGRKSAALAELDRALAIDPEYEPAILNRLLVEKMEEGSSLSGVGYQSINYSVEKLKSVR